jgi:hypothetical protein
VEAGALNALGHGSARPVLASIAGVKADTRIRDVPQRISRVGGYCPPILAVGGSFVAFPSILLSP